MSYFFQKDNLKILYLCPKQRYMFEDFRLKVFMTVAREKSFTKAAAELGITQPAVSQNVSELEKATGVKLFERLRGEVVLTPQGEVLLEHAVRIAEECTAAGNLFVHLQDAQVRISASEELYSFFVAPALEEFMTVHPEVSFEKAIFEDADLVFELKSSPESPFDINPDSIARVRMSVSRPPKMGDFKATHEKSVYFDVLYRPTQAFACTKLCRLLKEYLTSF